MASNVELKYSPLPTIIDSPKIDPNTGRPRTPNKLPAGISEQQRLNISKVSECLFSVNKPTRNLDNFPRNRCTYMTSRNQLYMQKNDLYWIGPQWSRKSEEQHDGSPPNAILSWPQERAGRKIEKHLKNESREDFLAIELERRPPTNLPDKVVSKFGRGTCGYYAERFPNRTTWFQSCLALDEIAPMYHPVKPQPFMHYKIADVIQKNHTEKQRLPTEYQERFLAHKRVPHKFWD